MNGKQPRDYYIEPPMTPRRALALAVLLVDAEIYAARRTRQYDLLKECKEAAVILRELKAAAQA